jgi:mono/diheme cytochrome c family protein
MRIITKTITAAAVLFGVIAASAVVGHGQAPRTVWEGVYSTPQAERGAKLFGDQCSSCHGVEMKGGPGAPGLVGPEFQFSWDKKTVGALHDYAKMFMPPGQAGTLTDQQYADIVAALLQGNGFPAAAVELPAAKSALDQITILATKP